MDEMEFQDWSEHFDDSSSAGYVCRECGALVPRLPKYQRLHVGFHRSADG